MYDITIVYIWVFRNSPLSDCISWKKLQLIISHEEALSSSYAKPYKISYDRVKKCVTCQHMAGHG
jgi:hypothetical protein